MKQSVPLLPGLCLALSLVFSTQAQPVTDNLQLWLKADAGITKDETGKVTSWTDQSPNGHVAAPADPVRAPMFVESAINGQPAVRFDGATAADQVDALEIPSDPTLAIVGDISSFFVVRVDDYGGFRSVWGKTLANQPAPTDFYFVQGSGIPRLFRGNGLAGGGASVDGTARPTANNPLVYGFSMEFTTVTHYFNGEPAGTGEITAFPEDAGTPLIIGSRANYGTKMKGDIAEVLIYDRALTPEEVTSVTGYLKGKYGLQNEPPVITLTSPANDSSHAAGTTVNVTANVTDPDSAIARVNFFANGSLIGSATAAPFSIPLALETAGAVTITAEAIDTRDGRGTATPVNITITPGATQAELPTTNLKLWLKADAGITAADGEPVVEWQDSSGTGNHAVQDVDFPVPPTFVADAGNGQPAVRFTPDRGDYLQVPHSENVSFLGDIATFAVLRVEDFLGFRGIWGKTGGAAGNLPRPNDWYIAQNSGVSRFFRGNDSGEAGQAASSDSASPIPVDTFVILGLTHEGNLVTHYLNGSPFGTGQITIPRTDDGNPLRIGTRQDFVTQMKGDISELVIYDGTLSSTELVQLSTYLGAKYGIAVVRGNNAAPTIQLTAPTEGLTVTTPADVALTATAEDAGGTITRVEFYANGALVSSDTTAPYTATLNVGVAGSIALTAVAVDNFGARSTSTAVNITATAPEPPPIPVDGLQFWVRADKGVTKDAAGAVSLWEDFSGKFNHARQPSATTAPVLTENAVNGMPVVTFDGADDFLEVTHSESLAITGDITTFFVVNFADFEAYRAVWAKTAGNQPRPNDYYIPTNAGMLEGTPQVIRGGTGGNGFFPAEGTVPAQQFIVTGWDQAGTALTHYLNGEVIGNNEVTVAVNDGGMPMYIGTRGDFFTRMKGAVAEIVIYNRALSETERNQVHAYLNDKYGLGGGGGDEPAISVAYQDGKVMISWPEAATNFELEGATTLTNPQWGPVAGQTTVEGGVITVSLDATGEAQFFRLRQN